jgi:Zn-dependent peptidase ImmA (M78 family)
MPLSQRELIAIEAKAFELIQNCKITSPPVDVEKIAKSISLTVFPYDLGEVSGALIIENNQAYIGYNPSHNHKRKRFTIGHEIGHYCLHCVAKNETIIKDQLFVDKDFIVKYRNANNYSYTEQKQEQQANAFAAALLMPVKFIKKELCDKKNALLDENALIDHLADCFDVSVPAMTFRLENMNDFPHE